MGQLLRRHVVRVVLALTVVGAVGACGEAGGSDEVAASATAPAEVVAVAILQELDPPLREAFRMAKRRRFNKSQDLVAAYLKDAGPQANHVHARFVQAFAYQKLDHNEQARQLFEWVLEKRPDYIDVQHYYGFCLYYLGDLDGAKQAFETYLDHWPDQSSAHHGLGMVALEEGRSKDAKRHFERAIALNPDAESEQLALSHARLGDVYMNLECPMDARRAYTKAVTVWPPLDEAWYALHRVLMQLGDSSEAEAALKEHTRLVARGERQGANGQ